MESKTDIYKQIIPQIESLLSSETDMVAGMANLSAVLKDAFRFFWCGFYVVRGGELVLGPFQGTPACTRIAFGRGVCGTAWKLARSIVVDDVEKFDGHIACSSLSRSEIVVPVFDSGEVVAVLDIDSENLGNFNDEDRMYLERIVGIFSKTILRSERQ